MNFDQGMRRLAILAGVLGATAGGAHSYKVLRTVPSERYQHKVFESLAASDVVKQARARLLNPDYDALAKKYGGTKVVRGVPPGLTAEPIPQSDKTTTVNLSDLEPIPDSEPLDRSATEVNGERIETIFWNRDLSVNFFAMRDGGILESGPSPSASLYLLWVAFPALGFIALWGAIRGIGWVVAGFIGPSK
jgi:hypothetical protein